MHSSYRNTNNDSIFRVVNYYKNSGLEDFVKRQKIRVSPDTEKVLSYILLGNYEALSIINDDVHEELFLLKWWGYKEGTVLEDLVSKYIVEFSTK